MEKEDIFLGSAVIAILVSVWMVWPFADAILWGVFTAYFLHYFADYLNRHLDNRAIATGIMVLVLVGFVGLISFVAVTSLTPEHVSHVADQFTGILLTSVDQFSIMFDLPGDVAGDLKNTIRDVTSLSSERVKAMVSEIPPLIINILIYFVVAAFLLKDGKQIRHHLFDAIGNLPDEYRHVAISVVTSINELFRGVFLTYLVVALAVGTLATAGFYAMGINFYWGWGIIIGIFAFFPVVSAPMVYVPLSLLYMSLNEFWMGVAIFTYGVIVLNALPEVIFRPYMAAHHTQEHPLLLFMGFIIGPLVLGLKGVILGPMILVVTKNLLTMKYFGDTVTPFQPEQLKTAS